MNALRTILVLSIISNNFEENRQIKENTNSGDVCVIIDLREKITPDFLHERFLRIFPSRENNIELLNFH